MPYFFCIQGDCQNANISEPGCFPVTDSNGREWLCCRKDSGETPDEILELMKLQYLARKQGFSSCGTSLVGETCEESYLPRRLGKCEPLSPS